MTQNLPSPSNDAETPPSHDIVYPSALPFALVHLACLAAIWTGVGWKAAAIGVGLYWLRIFAIGAGYHRYFSHRAYETSRAFQFVLAALAQTTAQKSVLWWAAKHRQHHLHSDTPQDVHSPVQSGFLYSHFGWIFDRRHEATDLVKVADLAKYPELMWLHRNELAPAVALAIACFAAAGLQGLVVGFFWSTVAVYHATFSINSIAHVAGRRRYVTGDDSRNNWLLAIFTMGEGWHNNHHAFQSSVRQGFRWWEYDPTFYLLKLPGLHRDDLEPEVAPGRSAGKSPAARIKGHSARRGPGRRPLQRRAHRRRRRGDARRRRAWRSSMLSSPMPSNARPISCAT